MRLGRRRIGWVGQVRERRTSGIRALFPEQADEPLLLSGGKMPPHNQDEVDEAFFQRIVDGDDVFDLQRDLAVRLLLVFEQQEELAALGEQLRLKQAYIGFKGRVLLCDNGPLFVGQLELHHQAVTAHAASPS